MCMKDGEAENRGGPGCQLLCSAARQPLLGEDLVWSVRIRARNYFAKSRTVRTVNLRGLRAGRPGLARRRRRRTLIRGDVLISACLSATDEYKLRGGEKVKYIAGDEAGVDGHDGTVRDSSFVFLFQFDVSNSLILIKSIYQSAKIESKLSKKIKTSKAYHQI